MTHPKKVRLFIPWSKAMVAGATVDNPDYSSHGKGKQKKRKKRKRRRSKHAKKD